MSDYITLVCPSCGGKTQFSASTSRFVCEYCGNEHIFQLPRRGDSERTQERRRPVVPRPAAVTIQKDGGDIKLVWRWYSPKYIFLAFFCMAWDGFLIFWYSMALTTDAPWIMCVFPIAHLAVGVGLTYSTLAGFLNRSTLRLNRKMLIVQHDPLPWTGEAKVPVADLEQLYCKSVRSSDKNNTISYQLCAVLKDGREIKLLSGLEAPEVGIFMEQQIERLLKIPDEPVGGEIER